VTCGARAPGVGVDARLKTRVEKDVAVNLDPRVLAMDGLLLCIVVGGAWTDLRRGKVYNALTYSGVLAGIVLNAWLPSPPAVGAGASLLGLLVAGGPLFLAFLANSIGAGDVKLMAAVGAFVGPRMALDVLLYTCLAGAVLSLAVVLWREGVGGVGSRLGAALRLKRAEDGVASLKFPFGVAILVGTAWAVVERHLGRSALDALRLAGAA
jgi:prepilin peptidase CpaA